MGLCEKTCRQNPRPPNNPIVAHWKDQPWGMGFGPCVSSRCPRALLSTYCYLRPTVASSIDKISQSALQTWTCWTPASMANPRWGFCPEKGHDTGQEHCILPAITDCQCRPNRPRYLTTNIRGPPFFLCRPSVLVSPFPVPSCQECTTSRRLRYGWLILSGLGEGIPAQMPPANAFVRE